VPVVSALEVSASLAMVSLLLSISPMKTAPAQTL
jgi:hypothetical protein